MFERLHKALVWFRPRVEAGVASTAEQQPASGEDSGPLLSNRLAQAGIDEDYVCNALPELHRQMVEACANCPDPEACRRDLATGDWETGQRSYCPNAAEIDRLVLNKD